MKIGILYNVVDRVERGFDIDAVSDNDIVEILRHVQKALADGHEVIPVRVQRELLPSLSKKSFDCVFNLCEGIGGDNRGEEWIPALLDIIGIPYTGSDSLTLGLCLDKVRTKQLLIANNIPTSRYQVFHTEAQAPDPRLSYPLIVKPAHEDASVGITMDSVVAAPDRLAAKVEFILTNYKQQPWSRSILTAGN